MRIDMLVDARTREAMTCESDARVFCYDPRADGLPAASRILRAIRAAHYDAAIDFEQVSVLTAAFLYAGGIPVRVGFIPPGDERRRFFLSHAVDLREGESMWQAMNELGRIIDPSLPKELSILPIPISATAAVHIDEWWQANIGSDTGHVVAMHLGVGPRAQYRRWPLERFAELARRFKSRDHSLTIVFTGEQAERPLTEAFKALYDGRLVDATGLGSIQHSAALVERCDLLISADTGLMHLAAAMATPTVGIFGPNTPKCWAPVGQRAAFVYVTRVPCSPCINSYRRIIPDACFFTEKSRCMLDVSPEHVLKAARRVVRDRWLD
jgi:ADP-heptose:LPS heptosyltransferase